MPDMKMARCANFPGAMSRLSEERGFRIRVKMLSLLSILRESRAVMSSPVYSASIMLGGMLSVAAR